MFECVMSDGSVFKMPDEMWEEALWMKYQKDKEEEIKEFFRIAVQHHWDEKTVPTKYREDQSWEKFFKEKNWRGWEDKTTFDSQAELGQIVMYFVIRCPLLALILRVNLPEEEREKAGVIAIRPDGSMVKY